MCVGHWRILHFTFSIFHSNAGEVALRYDLLSIEYDFCSETNWNFKATRTELDATGNSRYVITDQTRALLDHYRTNDCIEVYFLGNFVGENTKGFHNVRGIALARTSEVRDLAHELGHALGLSDCYPYVSYEETNTTINVLLPEYYNPIKRSSFVGENDWGRESGRGFYELEDTHGAGYAKFLMYGYVENSARDIPDGKVYSLMAGAQSTNDAWYVEIGAEGIKTNNLEVYTE